MVNLQYIAILQIFVFSVGIAQEIASTGTYSNTNFTWATNIPSLQFSFNYTCSGTAFCQVNWELDDSRLGFARQTGCISDNISIAFFDCEFSGSTIIQKVTIFKQFSTDGDKKLDVEIAGATTFTEALKIRDCDSSSSGITTDTVDSTGLSTTFNDTISANCRNGFEASSNPTIKCKFDSSWFQEGNCTAKPPKIDNNTRGAGGMSEGDVAGTVLTCIFILECICLCVFVFALNYALSPNWLIGLYVAGICFSIIGIFMCFFGSSTAGTVMNSVEIAGTVLGSVGITVMLGGIVMQALEGVGSKE